MTYPDYHYDYGVKHEDGTVDYYPSRHDAESASNPEYGDVIVRRRVYDATEWVEVPR